MKIKLANEKVIDNVNIYLNGQYQEELVIQITDIDIIEVLNIFNNSNNLSNIQVYEDDNIIAYYVGYISLKNLRTTDNLITIVLSQSITISSLINKFQTNVVELSNNITNLDKQVNPIFNWDDSTLEECKKYKITESKNKLESYLFENPLISSIHGDPKSYSVTSIKQMLMMNNYLSWQIESSTNPDAILKWNETGRELEVLTEEQYIQLMIEIKEYVYPKVELQQHYEIQISNSTSKDEIKNIIIDYTNDLESKLPEESPDE